MAVKKKIDRSEEERRGEEENEVLLFKQRNYWLNMISMHVTVYNFMALISQISMTGPTCR